MTIAVERADHRKMQLEVLTVLEGKVIERLRRPRRHHIGHVRGQYGAGRDKARQHGGHDQPVIAGVAFLEAQPLRHGHGHRRQEHHAAHGGGDKKAEQHAQQNAPPLITPR